jgi:hypothetical protein
MIAAAVLIAACFGAVIACGTTHPVRATAAAVTGIGAVTVFLAGWRRRFGPGRQR